VAEEHLDEDRKTEEEVEREDEAGTREIMRPTTHEMNRLRTGKRTKNRTQGH
jgi:hypothetical protein